jgi:prephenate dehydrogenase
MIEETTLLEDLRREFTQDVTWVDLVSVKKNNITANVTALKIGADDNTWS